MEPTLPPLPSISSRPPSGKPLSSPPVDLNALLSYKLSIDFAPLSSSLLAPLLSSKADSSEIDSLRAELAVVAAASESLKELLSQPRSDSDSLPSVPLTKFLEMESAANLRFDTLRMELGASRLALEERVEAVEAQVASREGGSDSLKTERSLSGIATEAATTSAKDATDAAVEARAAAAEAARSAVDADRAAAFARTAANDLGAATAAAQASATSAALEGAAAASKAADEAAARLAAALKAVGLPAPPPTVPPVSSVDLGPLEEKLQQLAQSARETQERAEAIGDKVAVLAAKEDVNTTEHALLTERCSAMMKLFDGIFTVTSAANAGNMASDTALSSFPNHKSLIDFASLLNKITTAEKVAEAAAIRATAAEAAIANLTSELWAVRAAAERGEAPPPRTSTPPVPPPSAPGVSIKEMDALRAEVKAGLSSLGARMGGAEGVGLSALKDARDAQKLAERALAAAASGGGGGGGGGGSGKYDILEPDIASWAAALTHAVSITAGGAADAPPSPASALGGWRALADRAASALSSARPAGSAFEVRALSASSHSLDQRLTAAEAAARAATTQCTSDRALLPAPGQLAALEAADGLLEGTKADKDDTDARLSSLRSALAGMASRVNDVAKRAAEAKASASAANVAIAAASDGSGIINNNGSTGGGGGSSFMGGSSPGLGAAATGRQLLRDLYCISCSRPADNVSTDRGPHYITGVVMPSTVLHAGSGHAAASHAHHFVMNDAVDTAASALEPFERATRASNLTALSGTGAFQVLPNGQVISKISMRTARGPNGGGGGGGGGGSSSRPSGELEAYADAASTLGAAGMVSLSANHRSPAGAPASARLYPPPEPRASLPAAPETARTLSDQGLPASVVHRGGVMPSSMSAGVSVGGGVTSVASPVVDPKLGTPLPHFYAADVVAISSESNE